MAAESGRKGLAGRDRGPRMMHRIGLAAVLLAALLPWPAAEAGFMDRVKDIYGMPERVEELQQQYDDAQEELDASVKRSEETIRKFQQTQEQLLRENQELKSRNARLEEAIGQMEAAERAEAERNRRITRTALAAGGLVVLYFVLMRVVRLAVWRRTR
ncbi:hypothetical protein [Paenibacillus mucilaginosus]|uniref:Uncharacterized protein n=1 Tax=Paenibacillus mucilaginosus (strain KNP414) TaxID=1036673 RepID=F8FGR5_PAEMK|nr:hypothetical protein [Paenibacillus mucilaginosus]AEI45442.1 hypothetical protein KNP414_06930 [Paenibacillus mucilaginosus KNP414]MCG7215204.1 hypothetical protein [Paenibacillus mucilaginosus]WDM26874.1 hypothetical protein KCX80_31440 [Paenibacillus mucilaginosus]